MSVFFTERWKKKEESGEQPEKTPAPQAAEEAECAEAAERPEEKDGNDLPAMLPRIDPPCAEEELIPREALMTMSEEEINRRWKEVRRTLAAPMNKG